MYKISSLNRPGTPRVLVYACLLAVMFACLSLQPASGQLGAVLYATSTGTGDCLSWATACGLQTALAQAQPGSEIWVAAGTYTPTGGIDRTVSFVLKDEVAIYGGFAGTETARAERDWAANITILSGDIGVQDNPSDNSLHVVRGANLTDSTVLDGFTITGGAANSSTTSKDRYGGGMSLSSSYVILANLTFSRNYSLTRGGALNIEAGAPAITGCTFADNTTEGDGGAVYAINSGTIVDGGLALRNTAMVGGAFFIYDSEPEVRISNFTFANNTALNGGAVRVSDSQAALSNVTFTGNRADGNGGGLNTYGFLTTILNGGTFQGNTAGGSGGAIYVETYAGITVANAVIAQNEAVTRGGAIAASSSTRVVNSTVYKNKAGSQGGGVTCPTLRNSIVWGNTAASSPQYGNTSCTNLDAANSIVQGATDNPDKKVFGSLNPLFVSTDDSSLDLRLKSASPAVDMGKAVNLPANSLTDAGGNPRVFGGEVDMGAYEQQSPNHPPVLNQTSFELPTIFEDDSSDQGVLVSDLITNAGTDADGDPLGVLLIASDRTNGYWLYDNGEGQGWIEPIIFNNCCKSTVLGPNARLRFYPKTNWNGTLNGGLTFRLWDMTNGSKTGDVVNLSNLNTLNGSYSVQTGSVSITVTPLNDPPALAGSQGPYLTGAPVPGQVLTVVPGVWDDRYDSPDSPVTLTYQWRIGDIGGTFVDIPGETGPSYIPTVDDIGKRVAVVVTATDQGIGEPPSLSTSMISPAFTIAAQVEIIAEGDVLDVIMDEDGSPKTFQGVLHPLNNYVPQWAIGTAPGHGTASVSSAGVLSYSPATNYNGADQFTVTATLGDIVDTIAVTVEILPRNDAPVAAVMPSLPAPVVYNHTVNASRGVWNDNIDRTPGQITLSQKWQKAPTSTGPWADIPGETGLSYTPLASDVGYYLRLLVTATDNGEGLPVSMASQAVSLPGLVTNNPPVIGEGSTLDVTSSPVQLHASDSDGHNLFWEITSSPSHGSASIDATGKVTYQLYPNCSGMDSITVRVTDGSYFDTIVLNPPGGVCRFYADDSAIDGANNGSSWQNAFTDMKKALTSLRPGDELWVAEGIYYPSASGDRYATFPLTTNVKVYGGFAGGETERSQRDWAANPTILSGDIGAPINRSDNSYHVITTQALTASTVLDGFIVQDGNATNSSNYLDTQGGGMLNKSASSPTLRNLIFRNNSASSGGGMFNNGSSPTLDHVSFLQNEATQGGGMYNDANSNPIITDSTFTGNKGTSSGGGMENDHNSPRLERVSFIGNTTSDSGIGGAMNNEDTTAVLIDVVFRENAARHGGAMGGYHNTATMINAVFIQNRAVYQGGAIHSGYSSNITVVNSVFYKNISESSGGAVSAMVNSAPRFYNSTFFGNQAPMESAVRGDYQSYPELYNCILWTDGTITTGIVGYATLDHTFAKGVLNKPETGVYGDEAHNPLFVDAGAGDLRLQAQSPAIDAGLNTRLPVDTLDLDGDGNLAEPLPVDLNGSPRVHGEAVDLGALEYDDDAAPDVVNDVLPAFDEDSGSHILDVLANDSDPLGGDLTITAVTQGSKGSVSIVAGALRYDLFQNANGTDRFTYTVQSASGASSTGEVTVTIRAVNDAPTTASFADAQVLEGGTYTAQFTVSDVEDPAAALVVQAVSSNKDLLRDGDIALVGSGSNRTLIVTSARGKTGTTTITITVTDTEGAVVTQSFTLTVTQLDVELFLPVMTQ